MVSGSLNDAAARKYDLEAWFPGYGAYRELCSVSNCTDYQSRSVNVRLRTDKKQDGDEKKYVHMLNGTLCATERTLCCILENYQTEKGLRVPDVLIPYLRKDFIPFVEELLPGYKPGKKEDKVSKGGEKGGEKVDKKGKGDKKDKKQDDCKTDDTKTDDTKTDETKTDDTKTDDTKTDTK